MPKAAVPAAKKAKKTLFVLMPFGDGPAQPLPCRYEFTCNYDQWYDEILRPAGEEAGFTVSRADEGPGGVPIMEQVWAEIQNADAIVAFLTGRNPNVYYELGLAHSLGKPVLLIADKREKIPFDLVHLRHYLYDDNWVDRVGKFKPEIQQHLEGIARDPDKAVYRLFAQRP